jgi:HK97 family phage prohead protease
MTTNMQVPFEFKALGDGNTGEFEASFVVFGNVDLIGDRMMPGSLDASIAKWKAGTDPLPVIWQHDWADPFAHIGTMDPKTLRVVDNKLVGKGVIDVTNPFAAQVYSLMRRKAVREFSFSQLILDERTGKDGANEIWSADLVEMGPALKGINPETELLKVKAQLMDAVTQKSGRVLSAKNETKLREAHAAITEVLALMGDTEDPAEKAVEPPIKEVPVAPALKAQEPPTGVKAEEESAEDEALRMMVEIAVASQ